MTGRRWSKQLAKRQARYRRRLNGRTVILRPDQARAERRRRKAKKHS